MLVGGRAALMSLRGPWGFKAACVDACECGEAAVAVYVSSAALIVPAGLSAGDLPPGPGPARPRPAPPEPAHHALRVPTPLACWLQVEPKGAAGRIPRPEPSKNQKLLKFSVIPTFECNELSRHF